MAARLVVTQASRARLPSAICIYHIRLPAKPHPRSRLASCDSRLAPRESLNFTPSQLPNADRIERDPCLASCCCRSPQQRLKQQLPADRSAQRLDDPFAPLLDHNLDTLMTTRPASPSRLKSASSLDQIARLTRPPLSSRFSRRSIRGPDHRRGPANQRRGDNAQAAPGAHS